MGGRGGGGVLTRGFSLGSEGGAADALDRHCVGLRRAAGGAESEEWQEHVGAGAGVWSWGSSCRRVCVLNRNATMLRRLEPLERKRVRCRIANAAPAARRFVFSENVQSVGNESVVENESQLPGSKAMSWESSIQTKESRVQLQFHLNPARSLQEWNFLSNWTKSNQGPNPSLCGFWSS